MESDSAYDNSSAYKLRVYGQAFVYVRRSKPKMEKQMTQFGVEVPVQNWYDELECPQLATNYNGLYIKESDVDKMLKELTDQIKRSLINKGLVV